MVTASSTLERASDLRTSAAEHGRTVADLLRNALSDTQKIKESHEGKVAAFLAATIHDAFEAIVILCGSAAESQVPLLARGLMEAFADLQNVCGDPVHAKHLHFTSECEAKRLWSDALLVVPDSEVDSAIREGAARRVAEADRMMAVLKAEGAKYMRKSEKFKTANVNPGSYWLYCFLCSPAHNDVNSLVDRFGDGEQIRLRARLPDADYFAALSIGGTATANTIALIPAFTNMSASAVAAFRQPAMVALNAISAAQRDYDSAK